MIRMQVFTTGAAFVLGTVISQGVVAGDRMSGDQISTLISGNTIYGKHAFKDRHGHSFIRADGTFVGWNNQDGPRKGAWEVRGDKYCRQPEGEKKKCREIHDNGDGSYNVYVKPKNLVMPTKHVWTWIKVVPGNPENLE